MNTFPPAFTGGNARALAPTARPWYRPTLATSPSPSEELLQQQRQACAPHLDPMLVPALLDAIEDSLVTGIHANAVFLAERLFDMSPTYRHLQILATCYARSGPDGLATACRLLQSYHPYFPASSGARPRLPTPASRGARTTAPAGPTSRPASDPPPPHPSSPDDRPPRAASVAARWDCQYLLGSFCTRAGRWADGERALEQLLRISTELTTEAIATGVPPIEAAREDDEAVDDDGAEEEEAAAGRAARVAARERLLRALGSVSAGRPRFYMERLAEVRHWLGVCAQRQHISAGVEMQRQAFTANPLLFTALDAYVAGALQPTESTCLPVYERVDPPPHAVAMAASMLQPDRQSRTAATAAGVGARSSRPSTAPALSSVPNPMRPTSRAAAAAEVERWKRREVVRRYLAPFVRATFLTRTFRCHEAQEALQRSNFPGERAESASSGAVTSAQPAATRPRAPAEAHGDAGGGSEEIGKGASAWRLAALVLAHFHRGDMRGCAQAGQALLAVAPWRLSEEALVYYSTALWQLRAEGALGALAQRMTEEAAMSPLTLCVVANAYSLVKEPRDALAMLDRALQVDASLAYAHSLRGYELLSLGMNKEARDAFHHAISADRNMYTAYAGLGELLVREEHIDLARQHFKHAISINRLPTIMNRYAATYHRIGASRDDLVVAYGIYDEAARGDPTNVAARHRRADVLLALGRPKEAMADLQDLVSEYAEEADVLITLARCQEALGLTQQAVRSYNRAAALDARREGYVRTCLERLSAAAGGEGEL